MRMSDYIKNLNEGQCCIREKDVKKIPHYTLAGPTFNGKVLSICPGCFNREIADCICVEEVLK